VGNHDLTHRNNIRVVLEGPKRRRFAVNEPKHVTSREVRSDKLDLEPLSAKSELEPICILFLDLRTIPFFLPVFVVEEPSPIPPTLPTLAVENYAQLSSLPGFRAFKLNDSTPENRESRLVDSALGSGSTSRNTGARNETGPVRSEWMQEIRVARRTKKQTYVRSGTHDFCIRLYTAKNET